MDLIFSTRNTSISKAKWHVGAKGGLAATGVGGVCAAMSAIWIAKSRAKGSVVITGTELGSQHLLAITQGAYDVLTSVGDRWLLASQNLPMGSIKIGKNAPASVIVEVLQKHLGYSYLKLSRPGANPALSEAHSMASLTLGEAAWFFDPNFGLYRTTKEKFQRAVSKHLVLYYTRLMEIHEITYIN